MNLKEEIKNFVPFNEQENIEKEYFLKFIDTFDDILTRNNMFGHISSSAFVVNKERTKMLVVYHIINDGWMYPGGHADGENDLLSVAIREVEEETGLKSKVLDKNIFSIQTCPIKSHIKRGKFVPSHIHFDVLYLLEANDKEQLYFREDESKGVKWINLEDTTKDEIVDFIRPVNKKLVKKLKNIY